MIELRNVSEKYSVLKDPAGEPSCLDDPRYEKGFIWAVRDITCRIGIGQAVALVGENGAGKSTLLKLIAGILKPDKGDVICRGRSVALLELGFGLQPELTGRKNIEIAGPLYGMSHEQILAVTDNIIDFAELGSFIDEPLKTYSAGMMARLGFSIAINVDPDIYIIDEVLLAGDQFFQDKCLQKIKELKRQKKTIVFASHSLDLVRAIADRALLLREGQVIQEGEPKNVLAMYERFIGRKEGIAFLKGDAIQILFNNGVISFFQENEILSISDGGFITTVIGTDKFLSHQGRWRVEQHGTGHVIARGLYYFGDLKQTITMKVEHNTFTIEIAYEDNLRPDLVFFYASFITRFEKAFINSKNFVMPDVYGEHRWCAVPIPPVRTVSYFGLREHAESGLGCIMKASGGRPQFFNASEREPGRILGIEWTTYQKLFHCSFLFALSKKEIEREILQIDQSVTFFGRDFMLSCNPEKELVLKHADEALLVFPGCRIFIEYVSGKREEWLSFDVLSVEKGISFQTENGDQENSINLTLCVKNETDLYVQLNVCGKHVVKAVEVVFFLCESFNEVYIRKNIHSPTSSVGSLNEVEKVFPKELAEIDYLVLYKNAYKDGVENKYFCTVIKHVSGGEAATVLYSEQKEQPCRRVAYRLEIAKEYHDEAVFEALLSFVSTEKKKNTFIDEHSVQKITSLTCGKIALVWEKGFFSLLYQNVLITAAFGLFLRVKIGEKKYSLQQASQKAEVLSEKAIRIQGLFDASTLSFSIVLTIEGAQIVAAITVTGIKTDIIDDLFLGFEVENRYRRWFTNLEHAEFAQQAYITANGIIQPAHTQHLDYFGLEEDRSCSAVVAENFFLVLEDKEISASLLAQFTPEERTIRLGWHKKHVKLKQKEPALSLSFRCLEGDKSRAAYVAEKNAQYRIQNDALLAVFHHKKCELFYDGLRLTASNGVYFTITCSDRVYTLYDMRYDFLKRAENEVCISFSHIAHDIKGELVLCLLPNMKVAITAHLEIDERTVVESICFALLLGEGHTVYYQDVFRKKIPPYIVSDSWIDMSLPSRADANYYGFLAHGNFPGLHIESSPSYQPLIFITDTRLYARVLGFEKIRPRKAAEGSYEVGELIHILTEKAQQQLLDKKEKAYIFGHGQVRGRFFQKRTEIYYANRKIIQDNGISLSVCTDEYEWELDHFFVGARKVSAKAIEKKYYVRMLGLAVVLHTEFINSTIHIKTVLRADRELMPIRLKISIDFDPAFNRAIMNDREFALETVNTIDAEGQIALPMFWALDHFGIYSDTDQVLPYVEITRDTIHNSVLTLARYADGGRKSLFLSLRSSLLCLKAGKKNNETIHTEIPLIPKKDMRVHVSKELENFSIGTNTLRLAFINKTYSLLYKGSNINARRGIYFFITYNNVRYDILNQQWHAKKINSEEAVFIFEFPAVKKPIIMRFRVKNENVITLCFSLPRTEPDYRVDFGIEFQEAFNNWFVPHRSGTFRESKSDYETEIWRLRADEAHTVGLYKKESVSSLPLIVAFETLSSRNESLAIKDVAQTEHMRVFELFKIANMDTISDSELNSFIHGELSVFTSESITTFLDPSRAGTVLKDDKTMINFDSGRCRIYYDGNELTRNLGLYTSYDILKRWHDSYHHAEWTTVILDRHTLKATGKWKDVGVEEVWHVRLCDPHTIEWVIFCYYNEKFECRTQQVNLMFEKYYNCWETAKKTRYLSMRKSHKQPVLCDLFPAEFSSDYGGDWDVCWSGDPWRYTFGVSQRDSQANEKKVPSIGVESLIRMQQFQAHVCNSDNSYSARVLRYANEHSPLKKRKVKKMFKSSALRIKICP